MKFAKIIVMALAVIGCAGCPKRQTTVRLAYVPAPPAPSPAGQGRVWVIQQPAPPQPAVSRPAPKPVRKVVVKPPVTHPHVVHKTEPEAAPADTEPAPQLEPLGSEQQQNRMRYRIQGLQRGIERRIDTLIQRRLSDVDRKAVSDARVFLSQSREAMEAGDLTESLNLAEKADLLVSAVEKRT